MASNNYNPTFELGFFLENVSEMVAETSETSKDQQSEIATRENNRFANLSERDLKKIFKDKQSKKTKKNKLVCFYVQG